MKVYGNVNLSEGSEFKNLTVARGPAFPSSPNSGEIFYHDVLGLTFHGGTKWNAISTDVHVFNDSYSTETSGSIIVKIIPSVNFKTSSTQLYIGGVRQKLGVDYQEKDGYLQLNYELSVGEVASGINIVLDFIKSNIPN